MVSNILVVHAMIVIFLRSFFLSKPSRMFEPCIEWICSGKPHVFNDTGGLAIWVARLTFGIIADPEAVTPNRRKVFNPVGWTNSFRG